MIRVAARTERYVVAVNAPYNEGGLGKFLAAVVEDTRAEGSLAAYFCTLPRCNDAAGHALPLEGVRRLWRAAVRPTYPWREFITAEAFDLAVARRLPAGDVCIGFAGSALHTFRCARRRGFRRLILESPTSHIGHVREQHRTAYDAYPIEASWLHKRLLRKVLREYGAADEIWVTSKYALDTFVAAGVPRHKLRHRVQPIEARFAPPTRWAPDHVFKLLYVGRIQTTKGIPVLLDAFARHRGHTAHLTILGGFASRAMQAYVERAAAADGRITLAHGDPLPHLHRADLLVHPSFEDGLGLAPLEALACGVPVVVTADTGMKAWVVDGHNGVVSPTGDVGALAEQLAALSAAPLRGRFAPLVLRQGNARAATA